MAIKYLYGTEAGYQSLKQQGRLDDWAFYRTVDGANKLKNLYFGDKKLSSAEDVSNVLELIGDLSSLSTSNTTCIVDAINEVLGSGGSGVTAATDTHAGIVLLYKTTGDKEDGTMTQKAITDSLKAFTFSAVDTDNDGDPDCLEVKTPFTN